MRLLEKELSKTFEPFKAENKWYRFWIENDYFKPHNDIKLPPFSIVIPPPNVTGSLHMGHALNVTLQDILARWKRMKGCRVLWVPGTDHAGIATQNVVENQLSKENLDRNHLGRKAFIDRVWEWKREYGNLITNQLQRLGASCDWSRERFTLDKGLSRAVREVFVTLFEEGLIYRSLRLINWCPRCYTALSDLEVEHEEVDGTLTYISYPFDDESGFITVATTRPETMLGDTAIAVNPNDDRYSNFIGKMVRLPLTNRTIPIIADREVDLSFGTGAVKVTPSHDFNDEAIAKRHSPNLPFIKVIGEDSKMTINAGEAYAGIDRYECRKIVKKNLKIRGFIEKQESHKHSVGHCYRCKTVIEPLPTAQWYVKAQGLAKDAIKAVKEGEIRIIPDGWYRSYYSWMENIKDWCISRQIWWGHQIPIWYCPECKAEDGIIQGEKIYHILSEPIKSYKEGTYKYLRDKGLTHEEIINNSKHIRIDIIVKKYSNRVDIKKCPDCGSKNLIRDPDVLDTWFSSALWPFSTLGWPEDTDDLKTFYPTSVLVTGFDILFFWVARMIMMGIKFKKNVPFKDVYIHALIRDSKGHKMSKSKGNVVDPIVMMDKYGTDAFRFTLAAFAAQGRDIRFSEKRVEGYRYFVNKLWNAARFIQLQVAEYSTKDIIDFESDVEISNLKHLSLPDKWMLSRLSRTSQEVNQTLNDYRFNDAANLIYQFIWHEFCDWYIEITKTLLSGSEIPENSCQSTIKTLLFVLDNALRLLHPFMPFVTEEIWSTIPHSGKTISFKQYREFKTFDDNAEADMNLIIDAVSGIRSIRGELNISPSNKLSSSIKSLSSDTQKILTKNREIILNLAGLKSLEISESVKKTKGTATSVKNDMEIYVPLTDLLNKKAEIERLEKELKKIDDSIGLLDKKLFNEEFLNRAPKNIVEKEKKKYEEFNSKKERIIANLEKLKELE